MNVDRRLVKCAAALAAMVALVAVPAAVEPQAAALAADAYGRGDYAEARRWLEQLDAAGQATPAELYRLYFSQRSTGAQPEADQTLARAETALEQAWQKKPTLEVGFYLANTYTSRNLPQDARRIAQDATARVAAGGLPATTGVDKFRVGKLYADAGDDLTAASWFRGAVADLEQAPSVENDGLVAWASRWLADRAITARDWSAAEIHLSALVTHSKPTAADYDMLAVVRVRNEMYEDAATAWEAAIPLDLVESDRARYAAKLASAAVRLAPLPRQAPAGQAFTEMSREELEQFLKDQVSPLREIRGDIDEALAAAGGLTPERREELRGQLAELRAKFVAAALEYTVRGLSLREAAFFGGYAPLVFREAEWRVPKPPKAAGPGTSEEPEEGADP